MAWVVDTCLLIDVAEEDALFARRSGELLEAKESDGLVACPVTLVEMGPMFGGVWEDLESFLQPMGVQWNAPWTDRDTEIAFHAWHAAVQRKRQRTVPLRPVADVLIGAFALRFEGLLTRNAADFKTLFPTLNLVEP
ncbi:MAG: type II toxin-antitoxin system VapC family toxin [Verrucomicrobia bacterium]|nr:type II toxin-antitoxin system VapC family toxin [Verrucomicrobiota bacterium]